MEKRKPRIVLAKPGLDGHDKGIRLVSMALQEAGFEVYYMGLRQTVDSIAKVAKEKDADFIGLSILSGVHLDVAAKMLDKIKEEGLRAKLVMGGVIPERDQKLLLEMGVAQVFPVETKFSYTNYWLMENCDAEAEEDEQQAVSAAEAVAKELRAFAG